MLQDKIEHIGQSADEIADFRAMLQRRDNVELVSRGRFHLKRVCCLPAFYHRFVLLTRITAIQEMKEKIQNTVRNCFRGSLYDRALSYLQVLRQGCLQESEWKEFNDFLVTLRREFEPTRADFWQLMMSHSAELLPVSNEEVPDSDVNAEQAKQVSFLFFLLFLRISTGLTVSTFAQIWLGRQFYEAPIAPVPSMAPAPAPASMEADDQEDLIRQLG